MVRAMNKSETTKGRRHPVLVQITGTREQRAKWHKHATASGMTLTEWGRRVMDAAGPLAVREIVEPRRG